MRGRRDKPLPYWAPAGDPVERFPLGVIGADPCLVLARPLGASDLSIWAVQDLDDGPVLRSGLHVAK